MPHDRGAATLEYALVALGVAAAVVAGGTATREAISGIFDRAETNMSTPAVVRNP